MSLLKPLAELPEEQREFINICENSNDNIFLEGPPWSGKSLICLYALQNIVREKHISALFMVSNNAMYGYMSMAMQELAISEHVMIDTKNKFFWKMAGDYRISINVDWSYDENYDSILTNMLEKELDKKYSLIIVNEVQDYLTKEWELIKRISDRVVCYGDFRQTIYSDKVEKETIIGDCVHKKIYYRSNDFSKNKLKGIRDYFFEDNDGENIQEEEVNSLMQPLANDIDYKVVDVKFQDELRAVGDILKTLEEKNNRTAVISPNNKRLAELSYYLQGHGIQHKHYEINQDFKEHDFTSTSPLFISLYNAEGIQFDNVILFGFDKYDYILQMKRTENKLKNLLYVALTRARNTTCILMTENTVEELKAFEKEFIS